MCIILYWRTPTSSFTGYADQAWMTSNLKSYLFIRKPLMLRILALEMLHHVIGDFESVFVVDRELFQ
jgi:hypothetical protein